jgi:hypothetical protein
MALDPFCRRVPNAGHLGRSYLIQMTLSRMSPLPQPNRCQHPRLEPMVKFKGEYETNYRCLMCGAVVTTNH